MANQYRGLLIGNATFPHDPGELHALHGPLVDINELCQALTDDEVGLFSPENVQMLRDKGVQELRETLNRFLDESAREDVLLLYYSGHGMLDAYNKLYLCASDTMARWLHSTALSADDINTMIKGSGAGTTVIVLDCCHSGAFEAGTDLTTQVAGRGRYVLASSRSTQLAPAANGPGQPSPFTGMLVRGLRHADAKGHLTISGLYQWMTNASTDLVPQRNFAGEGEVVIARRSAPHAETPAQLDTERKRVPPSSRESPPLVEPQVEPAQQPESPGAWQAHRVRTGGVACILRVTNGTEEHTIEYRSRPRGQAVVLLDGRRIYHGRCLLDCTFALGQSGPEARLKVTQGPDIQLWVGQWQVYSLHQATPGTDDFREHRAAAIRTALLGTKTTYAIRVRVVPDIGFWDRQAMQARTHRSTYLVSDESVIGVASVGKEESLSRDRIWFTDRALYIQVKAELFVKYYDELAAVAVTAKNSTLLRVGDLNTQVQKEAKGFAEAINAVKTAIVYQDTGLGDAPQVHLFSGAQTSYTWGPMMGDWFKSALSAIVLLAFVVTTGDLYLNTDPHSLIGQFGVLFISGIVGLVPAVSLAGIVESLEVRPSFSLTLFFLAVFTVTVSTVPTWWLFGIENVPLISLIIFFPVAALSMFQRHRKVRASRR